MTIGTPTPASEVQTAPRAVSRRAAPVVRTAIALLSVQGVTWASSLVGLLLIPRFLGSQQLGWFASLMAASALLNLLIGMGTSRHIIREVARNPASASQLVSHAIVARLLPCAVLFAAAVVGLALLRPGNTAAVVVISSIVGMTCGLCLDVLNSALQGNQTLGRSAAVGAVFGLGGQATVILVLLMGGRIAAIALVNSLLVVGVVAVVARIFLGRFSGSWRLSRDGFRSLSMAGVPFLAWDVSLLFYASIDMVLLPLLADAQTTGQYAFALRLAGIPIFIATIITASIFPELSNAAIRDHAWFKRLLSHGLILTVAGTVPLAVGMALLAPSIANVIGGGDQYARSVPLIVILSLNLPMVAWDTVMGTAIFALNRQKKLVYAAVIAAFVNPLINLAAIPFTAHLWDDGAIGAAVVTVATEIFIGAVIFYIAHDMVQLGRVGAAVLRSLVAAAGMAVVVLPTAAVVGMFPAVAAGGVTYGVLAVAVGLLPLSQITGARALLRSFRPRPGPSLAESEQHG